VHKAGGDHWLTHLHLGLMHYARGDREAARSAWEQSLKQNSSAWARRNLAVLSRLDGRDAEALSFYSAALKLLPGLRPLVVEYCEYLMECGKYSEVLRLIDDLPHNLRSHSRVQLLEAQAAIALRLPDRWPKLISAGYELVDIREGESSLTDFWIDLAKADLNHGSPTIRSTNAGWRIDPGLPAQLDFQVAPNPHFQTSTAPTHHEIGQDARLGVL
jgi:tetratricopeptide (TPR) repeat protein